MYNLWKFITSLALTFGVAAAGSALTMPAITGWYQTIEKPFFTPPNWIFGPVWTLLYFLMALAFFLIWKSKAAKDKKRVAMTFFLVQLAVNFLWSAAFFGLKQPLLGLIVIFILWGLIKKTIDTFKPISKIASYLLYPYLAWVTYAAILNFAIAVLNF